MFYHRGLDINIYYSQVPLKNNFKKGDQPKNVGCRRRPRREIVYWLSSKSLDSYVWLYVPIATVNTNG